MQLTAIQTVCIIASITLGTMLTRFLPFFIFPESKQPPKYILYLGIVLPAAMMGLLVVYCLKEVKLMATPYGAPEFLAIFLIFILHKWKNNVLFSICGGTIFYMILVQVVFTT